MSKYTKEDIKKIIKEEGVEFIRLMFTDLFGVIKNVEIPTSQIDKALDGKILFDGSSIDGFARINESDMYLAPDLDTFLIFPWTENNENGKVARLISNINNVDQTPFIGDPRNNLIRVIEQMKKDGFTDFNIGPEPEFFLIKLDENGRPNMQLSDDGGYFDFAPLDLGEKVRREIVHEMERMDFKVEAAHHEVAPGQQEVDFQYSDVLQAADKIQTFKLIVKTIARKYGYYATFMPKPFAGINGNGMHINMSLFKDGSNAFEDTNDVQGLSTTAYQFLGGLLRHASAYAALTNPTVNSYKRLVPGFEAPVYVAWSASNRSPMIRVPASRGNSTRLELRMVDPTANPYTAFAAILSAGLDGIENKLEAPESVDQNIFEMTAAQRKELNIMDLPGTLLDAVNQLDQDPLIKDALGYRMADLFISAKREEYAEFRREISQWELDNYLNLF